MDGHAGLWREVDKERTKGGSESEIEREREEKGRIAAPLLSLSLSLEKKKKKKTSTHQVPTVFQRGDSRRRRVEHARAWKARLELDDGERCLRRGPRSASSAAASATAPASSSAASTKEVVVENATCSTSSSSARHRRACRRPYPLVVSGLEPLRPVTLVEDDDPGPRGLGGDCSELLLLFFLSAAAAAAAAAGTGCPRDGALLHSISLLFLVRCRRRPRGGATRCSSSSSTTTTAPSIFSATGPCDDLVEARRLEPRAAAAGRAGERRVRREEDAVGRSLALRRGLGDPGPLAALGAVGEAVELLRALDDARGAADGAKVAARLVVEVFAGRDPDVPLAAAGLVFKKNREREREKKETRVSFSPTSKRS